MSEKKKKEEQISPLKLPCMISFSPHAKSCVFPVFPVMPQFKKGLLLMFKLCVCVVCIDFLYIFMV